MVLHMANQLLVLQIVVLQIVVSACSTAAPKKRGRPRKQPDPTSPTDVAKATATAAKPIKARKPSHNDPEAELARVQNLRAKHPDLFLAIDCRNRGESFVLGPRPQAKVWGGQGRFLAGIG